jgi:murein DD-endopeptidase MepM/ murein hydrolase activator NlpD
VIAALAIVLSSCVSSCVSSWVSWVPSCMPPPVAAPISVPYRAPACPYCAGHRGVGFDVAPGTPVRAVADGTVTFAGGVAGVRYVVVRHLDGRRATYGLLSTVVVAAGDRIRVGQVLARSTARLHFGLRAAPPSIGPSDGEYLDPTPELGRWVTAPRLVPVDRSRPRGAPPARLVCRSQG